MNHHTIPRTNTASLIHSVHTISQFLATMLVAHGTIIATIREGMSPDNQLTPAILTQLKRSSSAGAITKLKHGHSIGRLQLRQAIKDDNLQGVRTILQKHGTKLLISADPEVGGLTPFQEAAASGNERIVIYMRERIRHAHGSAIAELESFDALPAAVRAGHVEIAIRLAGGSGNRRLRLSPDILGGVMLTEIAQLNGVITAIAQNDPTTAQQRCKMVGKKCRKIAKLLAFMDTTVH